MPDPRVPGIYVEETSFRARSLSGVPISTAAFVAPAAHGPVGGLHGPYASLTEFERDYSGASEVGFDQEVPEPSPLWHAVRAFFSEGGARLYVSRPYKFGTVDDSTAGLSLPGNPLGLEFRSRYPGKAGAVTLRLTFAPGTQALGSDAAGKPALTGVRHRELVLLRKVRPPLTPAWMTPGEPVQALRNARSGAWTFRRRNGAKVALARLSAGLGHEVIPLRVALELQEAGGARTLLAAAAGLDDQTDGGSWLSCFAEGNVANARVPRLTATTTLVDCLAVLDLFSAHRNLSQPGSLSLVGAVAEPNSTAEERTVMLTLTGGADGLRPGSAEYLGENGVLGVGGALAGQTEIGMLATPGSNRMYLDSNYKAEALAILSRLVQVAEETRSLALLEGAPKMTNGDIRELRSRVNSSWAALYHPWIRVPAAGGEALISPAGSIAGVIARGDFEHGPQKGPAGDNLLMALGFEKDVTKGDQEVLNPEGINCLRTFEGKGHRVWGARTASDDPEWKYVNVRRYSQYLQRTINTGLSYAVFEPNGERLWASLKMTVENFLNQEWRQGALIGAKPELAYLVRCDRTTMSQADVDNGRVVLLVSIAPLKPAEFIVLRFIVKTAL